MKENSILKKEKKEPYVYKLSDLKWHNIKILQQVAFTKEPYFVCVGNSYWKLKSLNLITNKCRITLDGMKLLEDLHDKMNREKKNG